MSNTQVVLYLLALLLTYALAAQLDASAELALDRALAQSTHARCVRSTRYRVEQPAIAASASTQAMQPIVVAC